MRKILVGASAVALAMMGVVADTATAPEVSAVECVQNVGKWEAYNKCAGVPARHWDAIKNSTPQYGNWAVAGQWSRQAACWSNVVSYGYSLRS